MIRVCCFGVWIQVSVFYLAVITLLSFLDQTGIALWGLSASLLHEFGHIIALYLVGGQAQLLSFEMTGIRMVQKKILGNLQDAIVLSAGCLMNCFCFLLCIKCGILNGATVHLCIGVFNLLPSKLLDGGQLLILFLTRFLSPERAEQVCFVVSLSVSILLLVLGLSVFVASWNPTLLITGGFLLLSSFQTKS